MSQAHIWSSQARVKAAVALLLTFVAGYVDIVGYLALYQVFTANMTGNTVHFASNIVHSKWADAILAGSMIVTFVVGSILGRAIIEAGARRGIRRIASAALLLEGILVGVAGLAPSQMHVFDVKIGCLAALAFAMGLQTAALTRIGPLTVHTTFVTGMLNKLAQLVSHYLFLAYDRMRGKQRAIEAERQTRRESLFMFSIWLAYFVGAIAGTRGETTLGLRALFIPAVLLGIAVAVDQLSPLSLREEREQMQPGE
jgi:uncharacterized membrane protein YoaK (UPF0700 family)